MAKNACVFRKDIVKVGFSHATIVVDFLPLHAVIQAMAFIVERLALLTCIGHGAFVVLTTLEHSCSCKNKSPGSLLVKVGCFREGSSRVSCGGKSCVDIACFRVDS